MGRRVRVLVLAAVVTAVGACGDDAEPTADGASTSTAAAAPRDLSGVAAEVTVDLWHCGVRPVTFDGRVWLATTRIDQTTAPPDFEGTGTMRLLEEDLAVYTDQGSETEIRFEPMQGAYDPPPCA